MTTINAGIEYQKPRVYLLQESGLGVAEFAGRTAYDSFDKSENSVVPEFNSYISNEDRHSTTVTEVFKEGLNKIPSSELLTSLAWVHHHHSVLELVNLSYLIKDTDRGVLQEHSRHRHQSLTVRSTRYTMSSVINAFVAERLNNTNTYPSDWFIDVVFKLDLFVTTDIEYNTIQIVDIFNKLSYQFNKLGSTAFLEIAVAKSSLNTVEGKMSSDARFLMLEAGKKKRNVGDAFKHIVNDVWKVDMVVTMNLRALKNYLDLRASGAAYFLIRELAEAIIKATPDKYLKLIRKDLRN